MLFFSDLDKTLIYSRYPGHVCVEISDSKEITYMTERAIHLFNQLRERADVRFIPCTLRSYEQVSRIAFLNNSSNLDLICDNGFSIYHNGQLDLEWNSIVAKIISEYPIDDTYSRICQLATRCAIPLKTVRINAGAFLTVIFYSEEDAEKYSGVIISSFDSNLYKHELQGRKLYIIPEGLDKSLAVEYLLKKYKSDIVVTAGDGLVDERFVSIGDVKILPAHAVIKVPGAVVTDSSGILAGEEILQAVYNIIS